MSWYIEKVGYKPDVRRVVAADTCLPQDLQACILAALDGMKAEEAIVRTAGHSGNGCDQITELLVIPIRARDPEETEAYAGRIYTAYCAAVGGKAFNGDPLPDWPTFRADQAKKRQSDAWVEAAKVA